MANDAVLYTIGYQGRTATGLVGVLLEARVNLVVDIRSNPRSRKPGFSENALNSLLQANGIRYIHMQGLGVPKPLRSQLRADSNYPAFFAAYRRSLASHEQELLEVLRLARVNSCSLLCYECEPTKCHRSILARAIQQADGNGMQIRHL
ncbi:MAG: DUF488 domain-containing protein [Anaerolineae bacterium]|nr:DUF488 domain-containing protein [Anaerolineae bacterium]